MSAAPKPESTALALRDPVAIGQLPSDVQQQLELRRLSNQVAGELAKINWGAKLDLSTRRAVADWGRQFRVDVTTEIYVLGGNIYLNANFWIRKLSELIDAGLVEYAYADHVEDDARLTKLGAQGEGEYSRRLRERIMHQIPEKAASAVVFRIKLRSMAREVTGVKWCGNGTRKNDPVGDEKPVETSESRAARRAMRLLATHVPPAVAQDLDAIEDAVESITDRVTEARGLVAASEASIAAAPPGRSHVPFSSMPQLNPADPYSGPDESRLAEIESKQAVRVEAPARTEAQRIAAEAAANGPDPFADGERSEADDADFFDDR